MDIIRHGNISIRLKDDLFKSGRKIPIYHNESKPIAFFEMKDTNDLSKDTPQRCIVLSHTGKNSESGLKVPYSFPTRIFHNILLACRSASDKLQSNLFVNKYAISNDCYQNIIQDDRKTVFDDTDLIGTDTNYKFDIDIDRSSFSRRPDGFVGIVSLDRQSVDISFESSISQRTDNPDKILSLIAMDNQNPFPDHDLSKTHIHFGHDSYENVILNLFSLTALGYNGLSDFEEWKYVTLPTVTCDKGTVVSIIIDITDSSIDMDSFKRIVDTINKSEGVFHFNNEIRIDDLLGDDFITHPVFNRFFKAVQNGINAYEEIIETIIYMELGSLYKKEAILEQIQQIESMLSLMPDNSNFFGMDITDKNRKTALESMEKVSTDIRNHDA